MQNFAAVLRAGQSGLRCVEFVSRLRGGKMLFVSTWKLRPHHYTGATTRFLQGGAQPPAGIKTIGRWHYADGSGGVHVVECNDAQALIDFAAEWSDLLEIDIRPVVEDAQLGAALTKAAQARK
jgi:hypothetical protein